MITIRKEKLNLLNDIKVKKLRKRESVIDTSVKQQIMIGHSLLCKVNELKKTKIKEWNSVTGSYWKIVHFVII